MFRVPPLGKVEEERERKLRSLLTDQLKSVVSAFRAKLPGWGFSASEIERIDSALEFTLGQDYGPRDLDRYYAVHPIRVATFMAEALPRESKLRFDAVVASLVHNALEKKVLTPSEVESRYGTWVREALVRLEPDRQAMKERAGRVAYYERLREIGPELELLKFFDKFDNIFALCVNPDDEVRTRYLQEIRGFVRPIAERNLPGLLPFFDELVEATARLGHYRPSF